LIGDSAVAAACPLGYLDDADAGHALPEKRLESPFWRPPGRRTDPWRVRESYLPYGGFHAPARSVQAMLALLGQTALPPGSFVFVLSDFAEPLDGDPLRI